MRTSPDSTDAKAVIQCTVPAEALDPRYVICGGCTWHDSIEKSAARRDRTPCCPFCGSDLWEFPSEAAFQEFIAAADRTVPGTAAKTSWSRGKSFPDHETLENAWRQHMEGR
jgi:hypothetical protein